MHYSSFFPETYVIDLNNEFFSQDEEEFLET
jgi:hypothetical protein